MYIQSAAAISPQTSFAQLLAEPVVYRGNRLTCVEPDYSRLIDVRMIRRMSRIIKMGVAASKDCLQQAENPMPEAIITGTAYGCLADTELFLSKMVENREELLTPTSFIQSTHNTVGAQIALLLKCHNYNNTFVHRGFSFESALMDAVTLLKEKTISNALVGGVDEITDTSHVLLSRFGLYRSESASNLTLFDSPQKGTIAGEGAAFFLLAEKASGTDYAKLDAFSTFYKPAGTDQVQQQVTAFLKENGIDIKDIDLVITGQNGDAGNDAVYRVLCQSVLPGIDAIPFKHLCGEYPTATAFALWLAAHILKTGAVPASSKIKTLKRVLIYNHYQHIHHSLYLLSAC